MTFKLAVIGASGWAGSRHVKAFCEAGAEIVFLVDPRPSTAQEANHCGARHLVDYRDIHGSIDGAVVALPPSLQPEVCAALLRRGIPVLCEKPLATTVAAAAPLMQPDVPRERLMVGFMLRFHPAIARVEDWVSSHHVVVVNVRSVAYKPQVDGWRRERAGGGVVLINAVHPLDTVPLLLRDTPTVVATLAGSPMNHLVVEDYVQALMQFPSGAVFRLESYWSPFQNDETLDGGYDLSFEFIANDGRMVWRNHRTLEYGSNGEVSVHDFGATDLFRLQAQGFMDAVLRGAQMPISLDYGLKATALGGEILRSALGRPVA